MTCPLEILVSCLVYQEVDKAQIKLYSWLSCHTKLFVGCTDLFKEDLRYQDLDVLHITYYTYIHLEAHVDYVGRIFKLWS